MKPTILLGLLIAALLSACSTPAPASAPTLDIQTIVAGTLTAIPTATIPPTETATPLPPPSETPTLTATPGPSKTPKPTKTPKPQVFIGCFEPNGTNGPTAPFKIEVFGMSKATVYINGTSRNGNYTVYCTEVVKPGLPASIILMWGDYTYMIESGSSTRRGSFFINDDDKATMRIFKDKIQLGPFD